MARLGVTAEGSASDMIMSEKKVSVILRAEVRRRVRRQQWREAGMWCRAKGPTGRRAEVGMERV